MDIFGIGISEIVFILLIALIILGPKDMLANARKIGAWLRKFVLSEEWRVMQKTTEEIRNLPTTLMREANPDLDLDPAAAAKAKASSTKMLGTWAGQKPVPVDRSAPVTENTIAPPQPPAPAEDIPSDSPETSDQP